MATAIRQNASTNCPQRHGDKSSKTIAFSSRLNYSIYRQAIRFSASCSMFLALRHLTLTSQRSDGLPVWRLCTAFILGFGVLAPQAEASCGDYLTTDAGHFAMPGAREMEQFPDPNHVGKPLPGEPVRSPCHGPGCSSRDIPVTTAPVAVGAQHDLTWAYVAEGTGALKSPPRWATQPQESVAVQDFSFRILRPPRALWL
jgi:hypothetical protein